jgi:hypothetical protein
LLALAELHRIRQAVLAGRRGDQGRSLTAPGLLSGRGRDVEVR